MSMVTDALVLKVSDVGESDRVVTLLTAEFGVIRAFANRAKKINSKMQSAAQTLCYGEFSIYSGKDSYIIDSAAAKEVFFGLREDIALLSLGQYFCSLAMELIPEGEPAPESLRVILNSLSFLQKGRRTPAFLKAVTELKLISLAGFAPDLSGCSVCGKSPAGQVYFNTASGSYTCPGCSSSGTLISPGVLTAMKHVIFNPVDRIYSFALTPQDELAFGRVTEKFLLSRLGKTFKTLDFYKTVSQ
ncbi:MAG: DNA repair protein RecO [Clostridia bacterium]|nr:DNA repair protein RecO [Clostridia bacterium]